MEQCPYCRTEVTSDATVCPRCRAEKGYGRRSNGSVRHEPLSLGVVLAIALISFGAGLAMAYTGVLGLIEDADIWGIIVVGVGALFMGFGIWALFPQKPRWFRPD